MIVKMGGAGGWPNYSKAPKVTYSGKWLKWFIEFYNGVPYWEAWFFTSGTLQATEPYKVDAWGIGGGGAGYWGPTSSSGFEGGAGRTAMATGLTVSGNIAVTIGAGAASTESSGQVGGNTLLGTMLTCLGGISGSGASDGATYKRYRFEDEDKKGEMAGSTASKDIHGWLPFQHRKSYAGSSDIVMGDGLGAGAGRNGYASSGALVIRIPA